MRKTHLFGHVVLAFALFIFSITCTCNAEESRPNQGTANTAVTAQPAALAKPASVAQDPQFALGFGLGGAMSPGMFTLNGYAEYLFDWLFGFGPHLQTSFGSDRQYFLFTMDGKFRTSIPSVVPEFKLTALAGAGYLYRRINGFNYHDFTGHVGFGAEYFLMKELSAGLEFTVNITGAGFERTFLTLVAGINYYL